MTQLIYNLAVALFAYISARVSTYPFVRKHGV